MTSDLAPAERVLPSGIGSRWLRGIIPPVCTPLDADGEVDVQSLERHLEFLLGAGVHGLFMLGSSSEVAFLTDAQRARVLEVAVSTNARQVPILAGAIDMTTNRVIDQALRARQLGADGIVATIPFYALVTHPSEVALHFRTVRERVGLPVVAYDIPIAVHAKLELSVLLELVAEGVIEAVKDSSNDIVGLRALVTGTRQFGTLSVFTGSDLVVDCAVFFGAAGAVPGLANVDPHSYVELYERCWLGEWEEARAIQERLARLFEIHNCGDRRTKGPSSSTIGGLKTAMMLRGIIAHNTPGLPQIALDAEETARVRSVLEREGLL